MDNFTIYDMHKLMSKEETMQYDAMYLTNNQAIFIDDNKMEIFE